MSWLSNIFSGRSRDSGRDRGKPPGVRALERSLQLCRGVASAARAVPEENRELADRAVRAARRLSDALEPLETRTGAAIPGTVASSEGVQVPGEGPGEEERGELPEERLRESIGRLEPVHYDLIRLEVERADPEELGTGSKVERLEELVERISGAESAREDGG